MQLERTKHLVAVTWILGTVILGLVTGVGTLPGWGLLAAVAFGPPLVMLLLWKSPPQTMTESINQARR